MLRLFIKRNRREQAPALHRITSLSVIAQSGAFSFFGSASKFCCSGCCLRKCTERTVIVRSRPKAATWQCITQNLPLWNKRAAHRINIAGGNRSINHGGRAQARSDAVFPHPPLRCPPSPEGRTARQTAIYFFFRIVLPRKICYNEKNMYFGEVFP